MKKFVSILVLIALLTALLPVTAFAAEEKGTAVLEAEPVTAAVGDVFVVNVYLYPHLSANYALDSLQGVLTYDANLLTFGSVVLKDDANSLNSTLNSSASYWSVNTNIAGEIRFAYADPYGTDKEGFMMQLQFRLDKEGATSFIINGFQYSGYKSSDNTTVRYYLDPVQVGGAGSAGNTIPSMGSSVTYKPMEAAQQTAAPTTAASTRSPSGAGGDATTLPGYTAPATFDANVTAPPSYVPVVTPDADVTPDPIAALMSDNPQSSDGSTATGDANAQVDGSGSGITSTTGDGANAGDGLTNDTAATTIPTPLIIGIMAGVLVLGIAAIVILVVVRKKKASSQDADN